MLKRVIIILYLLNIIINGFAKDTTHISYTKAENFLYNDKLNKALYIYKKLLKRNKNSANLHFKLGYIYLKQKQKNKKCIPYLKYASKNISKKYKNSLNNNSAPIEALYFLAKAYHLDYEFDRAIKAYSDFKKYLSKSEDLIKIDKLIEECKTGKKLLLNPLNISIVEIGGNVNSDYPDHSPVLSADFRTLIFTSKRKSFGAKKDMYGNYNEDIYVSYFENDKWTDPKKISKKINTDKHEASVALSADAKMLIIYKAINGGDLFYSKFVDNEWTKPKPLSKNINSRFRETHASLSFDKKTMYFSSNRKGGFGGMDIYKTELQKDDTWGKAVNLGASINTKYNEDGPYINLDDSTLIFSSDGKGSMGGFDLFITKIDKNNNWSKPKNIGYPINSTDDDVFYMTSPGGNFAFYASNQFGNNGVTNIYAILLPEELKKPMTLLKGTIITGDKKINKELVTLDDIEIFVIDSETGDTIKTCTPNRKNGEYLIALPAGKKYKIVYIAKGESFNVENIEIVDYATANNIKKIIPLEPKIVGKSQDNYTIYFDEKTNKLSYSSKIKLKKTFNTLKKYGNLAVQIMIPDSNNSNNLVYTKTIMSYLKNHHIDTSRVNFVNTGNYGYPELLLADTTFLNFRNDGWGIYFDEANEIKITSTHKLDRIVYFLKRNMNMNVYVPIVINDMSNISKDRTVEIFDYLTSKGIDTSRIAALNQSYEEYYKDDYITLTVKKSDKNSKGFYKIADIIGRKKEVFDKIIQNRNYERIVSVKLAENIYGLVYNLSEYDFLLYKNMQSDSVSKVDSLFNLKLTQLTDEKIAQIKEMDKKLYKKLYPLKKLYINKIAEEYLICQNNNGFVKLKGRDSLFYTDIPIFEKYDTDRMIAYRIKVLIKERKLGEKLLVDTKVIRLNAIVDCNRERIISYKLANYIYNFDVPLIRHDYDLMSKMPQNEKFKIRIAFNSKKIEYSNENIEIIKENDKLDYQNCSKFEKEFINRIADSCTVNIGNSKIINLRRSDSLRYSILSNDKKLVVDRLIMSRLRYNLDNKEKLNCLLSKLEVGEKIIVANFGYKRISPIEIDKINSSIECLKAAPKMIIEIGGHTDAMGSKSYNYSIGKLRAKYIKRILLKNNIKNVQVKIKSYGESKPIASNEFEDGRKKNRRADMTIIIK